MPTRVARDVDRVIRTVIVAGAGASLAHAQSYRPSHALFHPPLDSDFFAKAQKLAGRDPGIQSAIRHVRNRSAGLKQFDDPFALENTSLEQYFADVYYEVATEKGSDAFDLFIDLLLLYVKVLTATTNWMALNRKIGDWGRLLRHELALCHDLTVITFNQDLVLENVAMGMPRSGGKWCLRSLYGTDKLSPLYARGSEPVFAHHGYSCPDAPPFRLLKLHGSLNWGVRSTTPEPKQATLFPTGERKIFMLDRRQPPDHHRMASGAEKGRKSWYIWPLIVPPIYDKHRVTGMTVLDTVWQAAREAVEACDRLVFVGYSLPDADIVAAQMIRRAFVSNPRLGAVECINPDVDMVGKLKSRLGCRVVKLYEDIDAYIEDQDLYQTT